MFDCVAISAPIAQLGESPLWDDRRQCLFWCDIPGCAVWAWWPATGGHQHWITPSEPASLGLCADGQLIVARRDGLWRFDPDHGAWTCLLAPPYDPTRERFNDGKVGPDGRFWVGTIYEPRDRPAGHLYCFDGQQLHCVAGNVTTSNGLAWSPDGHVQYWTDTKSHRIQALKFDPSGQNWPEPAQLWKQFPLREQGSSLDSYGGRPDGAATDIEGAYWVAMFEGARVLRLSPSGEVLCEIPVPARCPTMVCFGDVDLQTLYITTARHNRPEDELKRWPHSGAVFRVRVSVAGVPVSRMPASAGYANAP